MEEIEEIDLGRWRLRGQGCDEEDKARESGVDEVCPE